MRGKHTVLHVHSRIQRNLVYLAQDDALVGSLLRILGKEDRPTGIERRVDVVVATMHVKSVLGQRASSNLEHHGRTLARCMIILLHGIGQPLAGREIHHAATSYRQGGRPTLSSVLTFGLNRDLLVAPHIELTLSERLLVKFTALRGRRDGVKHPTLCDSRFYIFGHQRVTVAGDPNSGILGLIRHKELKRTEVNPSHLIH